MAKKHANLQVNLPALSVAQTLGIDDSHLTDFTLSCGKNFQVHPALKEPLTKLIAQAKLDDINITIVSAYRSFDRQLAIWNAKWMGNKTILSADNKKLDHSQLSQAEKFKAICHFSALPGFSRHHWGTDLDIFCADAIDNGHQVELVDREFAKNGPCNTLNLWLNTHLEKLGFYRPYLTYQNGVAAEPWHISHYQTSQIILQNFDKDASFKQLQLSKIKSAEFIQNQLELYYQQYFCNLCEPKQIVLSQ